MATTAPRSVAEQSRRQLLEADVDGQLEVAGVGLVGPELAQHLAARPELVEADELVVVGVLEPRRPQQEAGVADHGGRCGMGVATLLLAADGA